MNKFILVVLAIILCSSAFCADIDTLKKQAEQGDANAQGVLGTAYFDGTGAPQDYAEAYFWLDLASRKDAIYTKWRDVAVAELTPGKIEEVQARCKKWLEDFEKRKR